MNKSFIISGSGGQGILSIGTILASIFMFEDLYVTYCPCYGAEMRGGAVNCEINVSDNELFIIKNEKVDFVIALNQSSFDKFLPKIKENGTIIANSSLVKNEKPREDVQYIFMPFSQKANELGNIKLTNSIALGVLSKLLNQTDISKIKQAYETVLSNKPELIEKNIEAYQLGYNFNTEEK